LLMTVTFGLDITSRWSNSRPAKSGIPMVRK
jgi:hypothetical protein